MPKLKTEPKPQAQARAATPENWMVPYRPPTGSANDTTNWTGNLFTPNQDLLIHEIGRWVIGTETGTTTRTARLFEAVAGSADVQIPGAEATINFSGIPANNWAFGMLPNPVRVIRGHRYAVAIQGSGSGQRRSCASGAADFSPVASFDGWADRAPNDINWNSGVTPCGVTFLYTVPGEEPWVTDFTPPPPPSTANDSNHANWFRANQNFKLVAIGRWKVPGNTGSRTASLRQPLTPYTEIASVTINLAAAADNSWAWGRFATPIDIQANQEYVTSLNFTSGQQRLLGGEAGGGAWVLNQAVATYTRRAANFSTGTINVDAPGMAINFLYTLPEPPPEPITVSISPSSASLYSGQSRQFSATVENATNDAVSWSTNAPGGLFHAPEVAATTQFTVRATSVEDSTKYAEATVTVNPRPPTPEGGEVHGQNPEIRRINAEILQLRFQAQQDKIYWRKNLAKRKIFEKRLAELAEELKQAQIRARQ